MNFIEELKWRGMLQDSTPGVEDLFKEGPVTGYIGFDPTAASLTIGNFVQVIGRVVLVRELDYILEH